MRIYYVNRETDPKMIILSHLGPFQGPYMTMYQNLSMSTQSADKVTSFWIFYHGLIRQFSLKIGEIVSIMAILALLGSFWGPCLTLILTTSMPIKVGDYVTSLWTFFLVILCHFLQSKEKMTQKWSFWAILGHFRPLSQNQFCFFFTKSIL